MPESLSKILVAFGVKEGDLSVPEDDLREDERVVVRRHLGHVLVG